MKESERSPPPFAAVMNRRPEKIGGMLVHSGIRKLMMVQKFQTCRPIAHEAVRKSGEPFKHPVTLVAAFVRFFVLQLVIDVERPNEPVLKPILLEQNFQFQLRLLVPN